MHSPRIPGSLGTSWVPLPQLPSVKDDMVSINFSVKIRFKFILFRKLEENFMAPFKIPPGVPLGRHQSKARMVEGKTEGQKTGGYKWQGSQF